MEIKLAPTPFMPKSLIRNIDVKPEEKPLKQIRKSEAGNKI